MYSPIVANRKEIVRNPRVRQKCRDTPWLLLPGQARRVRSRSRLSQGWGDAPRHRNPSPAGSPSGFPSWFRRCPETSRMCEPRSSPTFVPMAHPTWSGEIMGFGKTPEEAAKSPMLDVLGGGIPRVRRHGRRCSWICSGRHQTHQPRSSGSNRADRIAHWPDRARSRVLLNDLPGREPFAARP